jgi:hypothetical protein
VISGNGYWSWQKRLSRRKPLNSFCLKLTVEVARITLLIFKTARAVRLFLLSDCGDHQAQNHQHHRAAAIHFMTNRCCKL